MIAIDCETTGLDIIHGCRPFIVTACNLLGELNYWEWSVDPLTRIPVVPREDVREIQNLIDSELSNSDDFSEFDLLGFVFHNTTFDIRVLESIGIKFTDAHWNITNDTLVMSHVLDNLESHGLKDLSLRYLGIPDDDEKELQAIVNKARRIAGKLEWRIAKPNDPHWPGISRGSWYKFDYWLPAAICQQQKRNLVYDSKLAATPVDFFETYSDWDSVALTYAKRDVERTIMLYNLLEEAIASEGLTSIYQEQRNLIPVIYRLEQRGVTLKPIVKKTVARYRELSESYYDKAISAIPQKIAFSKKTTSDFETESENKDEINLNSSKQLGTVLYNHLRLTPVKFTKGGQPSTDADVLLKLRATTEKKSIRSFLTNLLLSRKTGKAADYADSYLISSRKEVLGISFLNSWNGEGHAITPTEVITAQVLHSNYNQTGTSTTRLSSSNPNQQNIGTPKDGSTYDKPDEIELQELLIDAGINLRSLFGPLPNREWISFDYSSLQLRIFAYESNEENLIQAFRDGIDPHDYLAHRIFHLSSDQKPTKEQRKIAKNTNFGFIFGASPRKIEETARMPGLWDTLKEIFPNANQFIRATSNQVREWGYVYTAGQSYRLWVSKDEPYKGVNYIVQGDEGIIVKRAMIACDEFLAKHNQSLSKDAQTFLTLQIHDELIFDCPADRKLQPVSELAYCMEAAGESLGMKTPVGIERIEKSWDRGIKINSSGEPLNE